MVGENYEMGSGGYLEDHSGSPYWARDCITLIPK